MLFLAVRDCQGQETLVLTQVQQQSHIAVCRASLGVSDVVRNSLGPHCKVWPMLACLQPSHPHCRRQHKPSCTASCRQRKAALTFSRSPLSCCSRPLAALSCWARCWLNCWQACSLSAASELSFTAASACTGSLGHALWPPNGQQFLGHAWALKMDRVVWGLKVGVMEMQLHQVCWQQGLSLSSSRG